MVEITRNKPKTETQHKISYKIIIYTYLKKQLRTIGDTKNLNRFLSYLLKVFLFNQKSRIINFLRKTSTRDFFPDFTS